MTTTSQATLVLDKAGRQYELTCSDHGSLLLVRLHRSGAEVGTAKCVIDANDMLLADLVICDGSDLSFGQRLMRRLNGEPVTYQGLGLGTAVLKAIIQIARDKKIRTIHGSVTQQDLDKTPHLLTWYQQHGFQVEEPTEQEVGSAISRICCYLT
jgi:hypothetical protein